MADRKLPTSTSMPPVSGADYMDQVAEKVGMLFDAAALRPVSLTNAGNDYTMEVDPALDGDVVAGMAFYLQPEVGNTGPVRLREGANPFYDLTRADGSPLAPGDFSAGTVYFVVFVAGAFMIVSGGTGGGAMIDYQVFEASGTWIKPTGLSDDALILVEAWGGGGGGASSGGRRGGGGGGAYISRWMRGSDVGSSEVVQVGAGGSASTNPGGTGGTSSFGSHVIAYGGGGGRGTNGFQENGGGGGGGGWGSAGTAGGIDLSGTNGSLFSLLTGGGLGGTAGWSSSTAGNDAGYGGAGGGGYGAGSAVGGSSLFGGAGGDSGQAGAPRGGGGGGGASGGRGEVVVRVIDKRGGAAGGNDFAMPDGTAAEPGLPFLADPDTGFVRTDDDEMGLVAGGLIGFRQSSTQSVFLAGSAAVPSMTFLGDRNTGFFSPAADQIAAAVGGAAIWRTTAAGLEIVGNISTTGNFQASSITSKGIIGRPGWAGDYSASKVQGIWAIGDQYRIDQVANNFGDHFGLVYGYPSAGVGVANKLPIAGWGHQILMTSTGVPLISFSMTYGHGWFAGNVGLGPGRTDPAHRLDVEGTAAATNLIVGSVVPGASKLRVVDLPTSSAGLSAGDVWNDGGTLKIA